ncbi:hypothetical protein [Burkholderia pyrrocinia]|nr:hypothetical protein [Burkholderia pyrrocinia]
MTWRRSLRAFADTLTGALRDSDLLASADHRMYENKQRDKAAGA